MFEKCECEKENVECMRKVCALHLKLKNPGIMGEKAPWRQNPSI